ncbi:hypothetical protein BDW02DRAFT_508779 [Decorospora gaudefroyi]|uniref:C2H2-type domain-containing protein n=1 Tax=Decorospora gaudefroyi TaxID=184978 RepID=A0A6A5K5A1_9PLEO|nr:hypothetical protein BDW02DRAFT_508779 [Decorospora gaudefroyi]
MAGSLPKNRPHSHSLSAGNLHAGHRVTRRKSMSQTPVSNVAAIAAAAKGITGAPLEGASGGSSGARRPSKPASQFRGPSGALHSTMASSMPGNGTGNGTGNGSPFGASSYGAAAAKTEALTDGPTLATMLEQDKANTKARNRRASEGSRLSKGDGKRSGSDLRCEKCGKGYKHSSCLTKHLWEHTPEWQYTSKLLISKHQQVQLLEAASVLVAMNKESDGENSDRSSPPASGSSDLREELSSTETTPPPQLDDHAVGSYPHSHFGTRSINRYSTNSSAYSQSYQSTVFSDTGNAHLRQWSNVSDRPTTSGTSVAGSYHDDGNDQADLAAAVGLLSCSYGTPKTGPVALPPDVPPVPPLPAKFLDFNARTLSGSTTVTAQQSSMRNSYTRFHSETKDVDMDDDAHFADEEDYRYSHSRSRGRIDEGDDDEIFGRMEE